MRRVGIASLGVISAFIIAVTGVLLAAGRASNDREWSPEQAVMPAVTITDSLVTVRGVRNFRHLGPDSFLVDYDDRVYDLREIESVWYVLSPFRNDWRGFAHAFLSFGFADSQYVSVSVEARREEDEVYSTWKGVLRQYDLIYLVGDERDLIPLRAAIWGAPIYVYPARATPAQARQLFVGLMERAAGLSRRPEFYNTLTNNCLTNIVDEVNELREEPIPRDYRTLLSGFSDEMAHELDLIATDLPIEQAREEFLVDSALAASNVGRPDFSVRIRRPS